MRRWFLALGCASGLVVAGAGARAETWSIVEGQLAVGGVKQRLSGAFDASLFEPDPPDGPTPVVLSLDDFAFKAGRRELTPRVPVEYEGLTPVAWLQLADAILIEGEQVTFLRVRSGGKLVDESDEEVTYRFLELRADAPDGGHALGHLGDTALPRRLALKGDVYAVEQSFGLPGAHCSEPPGGGGTPGGGSGAIGSSGVIVTSSFGRRSFVWESPSGSVELRGRAVPVGSSAGTPYASSTASAPASVTMVVTPVRYYSLALDGPPSLEQLGIRAPAGADVSADANGVVHVVTTGDLFVEGTLPSGPISDLTGVRLGAGGRIVVTGSIQLPAGATLHLSANEIDAGELVPGEDFEVVPIPTNPAPVGLPDPCDGLWPILPAEERRVGRFSLVASAARQVRIDVRPGQKPNRVYPGSDQLIGVILFGSRDLDVRDIDLGSLRLGRGEAERLPPYLPDAPLQLPKRGRHFDLFSVFRVRDAEVAFGDSELCLVAETRSGELLEGCDSIDTRPPRDPLSPRR